MSKPLKLSRNSNGRSGRSPVGEVLRLALADDVLRILQHEPGARACQPEEVHQMRASVRRLRSDLRFLGRALPEERFRPFRDELRWLAGMLGEVRDLDVLEENLREAVVLLGLVAETDPLFEELNRRREARRAALIEAIAGDRHTALRHSMIEEARSPEGTEDGRRSSPSRLVDRLVKDWRRLLEEVESAPPDSAIETLHELRKRAKRTRYAAESADAWLGVRQARKIARRSRKVQEVLGVLQDAAVAVAFIREVNDLLPPGDGPTRSALETLIDHQRREADEALHRYGQLRDRLSGL